MNVKRNHHFRCRRYALPSRSRHSLRFLPSLAELHLQCQIKTRKLKKFELSGIEIIDNRQNREILSKDDFVIYVTSSNRTSKFLKMRQIYRNMHLNVLKIGSMS